MAGDEHPVLGLLTSMPGDIVGYGNRIADYVEKHSNIIATELRHAVDSASWIPDSIRPPVRTVSHGFTKPAPPKGFWEKTSSWLSENRTVVAVVLAFAGTTAILVHRRNKAHAKKRRARRDRSGRKTEIVVLACTSFHDPLTRSLALDLDRRGYIVYITVTSTEEDSLVQSEAKWDIRPLWMDFSSSVPNPGLDIHPNLEPIIQLTKSSSRSSSPESDKSSPSDSALHTLAGLVLLPGSAGYPIGPLATLPMTDLIDTINTRLLSPILTVQQFLPLLNQVENQVSHDSPPANKQLSQKVSPPSVILAYPSIPSSLHPPNQAPETVTTTSLSSLIQTVRREIVPTSRIAITELKLGLFDLGSLAPRVPKAGEYVYHQPYREEGGFPQQPPSTRNSALISHWHSSQRAAAQRALYGQPQPGASSSAATTTPIKLTGSSLRTFHNAVFDALHPSSHRPTLRTAPWLGHNRLHLGFGGSSQGQRTVYVGQGARLYDLVGTWVPDGLVGWMIRRQQRKANGSPAATDTGRNLANRGASSTVIGSRAATTSQDRDVERQQIDTDARVPRSGFESTASSGSEVWEKV